MTINPFSELFHAAVHVGVGGSIPQFLMNVVLLSYVKILATSLANTGEPSSFTKSGPPTQGLTIKKFLSSLTGQKLEQCLSVTTLCAMCMWLALEVSNTTSILKVETYTLSAVMECWK